MPPDDVAAISAAIEGLRARWQAGALDGSGLPAELRETLSRRTRSREFADVVRSVV